jgi:hypothetical protein
MTIAGNASFIRMSLAVSKANAHRKLLIHIEIDAGGITSAVTLYES